MGSFSRKLKRKQFKAARKKFMSDFKRSMREFKKQVKCSRCGYHPIPGENIDDWHIDQESNNIDLICTKCYNPNQEVVSTSEENQNEI